MNLKSEFISTILKNIREQEKKSTPLSAKSQPKKVANVKPNSKSVLQVNLEPNSKEKTIFEAISSQFGYKEVLDWISHKVNLLDLNNNHREKSEKESEIYEFDEFKTYYLFQEIFTDVHENQVQDFFDLFETQISCKISSVELFLIIAFVASTESFQTVEFLHTFGQTIFKAISGGKDTVHGSKVKSFGKLIGISERKLANNFKEMCIKEDNVNFEEFEMLYFMIFDEAESTLTKTIQQQPGYGIKKESKPTICKSGCNSFQFS